MTIAITSAACAQDKDATFEAASVKIHTEGGMLDWSGCQGGPGSNDPGRIECRYVTLRALTAMAYGLKIQEVFGPSWVDEVHFDLQAKPPIGAKRGQLAGMYQTLLAERFKLETHREKRAIPGYALTVGKSGLKMHAAVPPASDDGPPPSGKPVKGADGFTVLRPASFAGGVVILYNNGHAKLQGAGISIAGLAEQLSRQLNRIVVDETGVSGKFDITLYWAPQGDEPGAPRREAATAGASVEASGPDADLYAAMEQQLGLKVTSKRVDRDAVVIDKAEKTPIEN